MVSRMVTKPLKAACTGKEDGFIGCGQVKWIYNKSKKLCQWCNEKRKSEVRKKHGKLKPIKRQSLKREQEQKIYTILRRNFLKKPENRFCAVYRNRLATEVHHKKGRGKYFLDVSTWLAVCREAHVKITEDSAWAIENGYSECRNN